MAKAEAAQQHPISPLLMMTYIVLSVVAAVANTVSYKKLLNKYQSAPGAKGPPHNYEFFANQFNVVVYVALCAAIILHKRLRSGPDWWAKQTVHVKPFAWMGLLDAASGFLCSFGGAFCDGSLQNLLNQCAIPATMYMSVLWLGVGYSCRQYLGSIAILVGTAVAVVPTLLFSGTHDRTTPFGIIIFFSSVAPTAMSNTYKELAFRQKVHIDIYLLSACVAVFQVVFGFFFLPLLALPGFGGVPFDEMPAQMRNGFRCFLSQNSLPGDQCAQQAAGTTSMLCYCLINFAYNVLTLLVTKHASAAMMVVSAALALPVTNIAFGSPWIMGDEVESISQWDIFALAVVAGGFIVYSSRPAKAKDDGGEAARLTEAGRVLDVQKSPLLLPLQAAGGSMTFATRERSNSDDAVFGSKTPTLFSPAGRRSPATPRTPRRAKMNGGHYQSVAIEVPGAVPGQSIEMVGDVAQSL